MTSWNAVIGIILFISGILSAYSVYLWKVSGKVKEYDAFCEATQKNRSDIDWILDVISARMGIVRNGSWYLRINEED